MAYPDESNLTTLNTLKDYMPEKPPGTSMDTQLTALINRMSAIIIAEANYEKLFNSGNDVTEKRNGNGQAVLSTKLFPIRSITSLRINGATVPASDGTSAGYLYDDRHLYLIGYVFSRGIQNVVLVYKGGLNANDEWQLMLEQACLSSCVYWWKKRADIGKLSIALPQGGGTIMFTRDDLPPDAKLVIDQIKRIAPYV